MNSLTENASKFSPNFEPVFLWVRQNPRQISHDIGDLKITSTSTERQKRSENLAPVLVIISGKSLVFSRKSITSTVFTATAPLTRQHQ